MRKTVPLCIMIALIFSGSAFLFPVLKGSLDKLSRPSMFIVDQDRAYILEKTTVYIYSIKDLKLIKKFGKAGEGPKEFKYRESSAKPLSMCIHNRQLLVNSDFKRTFFDLDGNYIREEKVKVDKLVFPINGKSLGIGQIRTKDNRRLLGYTLHNHDYSTEKILQLTDFEMGNIRKMVLPVTNFTFNPVFKNRIYLNANSNEFKINVYDNQGKIQYVIEKNYPRVKVPKNFRQGALDFLKKSPVFKGGYERFRKILHIREFFPPIRDLMIAEDSIYVLTFKRKDDLWECIKLDLKGTERGRTFIKLSEYAHLPVYPILYSVYKGKIYSLVENEEDEVWQIHSQDIK